jgi:hypothetical protein
MNGDGGSPSRTLPPFPQLVAQVGICAGTCDHLLPKFRRSPYLTGCCRADCIWTDTWNQKAHEEHHDARCLFFRFCFFFLLARLAKVEYRMPVSHCLPDSYSDEQYRP